MNLQSIKYAIFIALIINIQQIFTASVPVTWAASNYFVSGTLNFMPGISGIFNETVPVTYANALSATPTKSIALGLIDFDFKINTEIFFKMTMLGNKTATGFWFWITSTRGSDILTLKINYLTVDPSFNEPFSIAYHGNQSNKAGPFMNYTQLLNFSGTGAVLNSSHQVVVLLFLYMFNGSSSTLCYSYDLNPTIHSLNQYILTVNCYCNMIMNMYGFSRIIFAKKEIENMGDFHFGEIVSLNKNLSALALDRNPHLQQNFIMGLKSFTIQNQTQFSFASTIGTITKVQSNMNYKMLSFAYWSFKIRICPEEYPYFQSQTLLCFDICSTGYYADDDIDQCLSCHYSCKTCSSFDVCTSCDNSSNWQQNGIECIPEQGYFDNGTSTPILCKSVLQNCFECTSQTNCISCESGFYLSASNTCQNCSQAIIGCEICTSSTFCQNCSSGYIENGGDCTKIPCISQNCNICPSSASYCEECNNGYQSISGVCKPLCGDFKVLSPQQCDDGNIISGDGCSSDCIIEQHFACQFNQDSPPGSICYFNENINFKKLYTKKISNKNQIQILLQISPKNVPALNNLDFGNIIHIKSQQSSSIDSYNIVKNQDGTIKLIINYSNDIQNKLINLEINPTSIENTIFSNMEISQINLMIEPDNNEGAYFYCNQVYYLAGIIAKICTGIGLLALFMMLVSIVCGKMVGIEMMAVFQITFFSLMTLSQMNPCFAALSYLWLVNGYNVLNNNHLSDVFTPIQPKGIKMFSRFTQNFNFTLAVVFVPLLISFISFILYKTVLKNNSNALKIAKAAVGEYIFMGLMFGGYLISVSFGLQTMYGVKNMRELIGKVSVVQCIILLALLVGYSFFLFLKPQFFGQFSNSFKKVLISSKFYNILLCERVIVGSCLIFLLSFKFQGFLSLSIFLILGIFIAIRQPYQQRYHNFRQIANMAIILIILSIFLSYTGLGPKVTNSNPIFSYLPLIICILLLLCIIYNGMAIIYQLYKFLTCQNANDFQSIEKQQLNELTKFRNISLKDDQSFEMTSKPNQGISSPKQIGNQLKLQQIKTQLKFNLIDNARREESSRILSLQSKSSQQQNINIYNSL